MIRNATYRDAPTIRVLLGNLGYQATVSKLINLIQTEFAHQSHELLVALSGAEVVGFVALHYVPQLGTAGDLALVSYLVVDVEYQGKGIGRALEEAVVTRSTARQCDRIELHCSLKRDKAHQFYKKQGYVEYPTYFSKRLAK